MSGNDHERDEEGGGPGGFNLDRAVAAARRRWKVIASLTLLAAALSVAIVLVMPNRYDASAFVQIDPRRKSISNLEGVVSELKADTATVESEVEVIRSRAIILKVIEILNLRNDPEFDKRDSLWNTAMEKLGLAKGDGVGADADKLAEIAGAANASRDPIASILAPSKPGTGEPERDEVAVAFAERLRVVRVRNTLLIDIRFSASDAVKAAKVANAIAEVYISEQLASKQNAAGVATQMLEGKLEQLKLKVAEAERRVEQWKAENNIFDSEGQILSEKQLARLMEQTVVARNATAEARAKYDMVQRLRKQGDATSNIADVLQSHTVRLLKEQLGKATRHEAELATKYGPRHPEMQKIRAEVNDAESQLSAEVERLVMNLKNELDVAEDRERQLSASLAALKQQQIVSKEAGVSLKELERDAATSKQLFEALLTRYKQTAETQSLQLPDARIIEKADVPLFPAAPKRKQIVLLATVGGLLAGLALVLAFEFMTPGIVSPDEVQPLLETPHLSSLPRLNEPGEPPVDGLRALRLVLAEPHSLFADAIRYMRREIDLAGQGRRSRVILVASSLPGEGGDLVASNLAHHYAMTGNRTLLVDADIRRAGLSRHLAGGQRTFGLAEALSHGQPVERGILRDQRTAVHFLPANAAMPADVSAPELLSSPAFPAALYGLRQQFDTIILTAPPLLPVIDGRIIADHVDQIIFLMTWRQTPKPLAKKALKLLGPNSGKVVGVALCEVAPETIEDSLGVVRAQPHASRPGTRQAA